MTNVASDYRMRKSMMDAVLQCDRSHTLTDGSDSKNCSKIMEIQMIITSTGYMIIQLMKDV